MMPLPYEALAVGLLSCNPIFVTMGIQGQGGYPIHVHEMEMDSHGIHFLAAVMTQSIQLYIWSVDE